jgi:ELWxxDGT repeat protein
MGLLTVVNGSLFFLVAAGPSNSALACSLWKSDGTALGTALVKSLNAPCNNDFPAHFTASGNLLFFSAFDSSSGQELWKSDGTTVGTIRVMDILPGSSGSNPRNLVDVNGILFFSASDGSGYELWRSDGTPGGTHLVRDILTPPSPDGSFPQYLTNVGGTLYFTANDGIHGRELWKSDGTQGGTLLVRDIRTGPSGSSPQQLTNVQGTLLFAAADHSHGMELWKSDGSDGGTVMIQDIRPGPGSSQPFDYETRIDDWMISGSSVFFTANDGNTGFELWGLPLSTLVPQSKFYPLPPCRVVDTRNAVGPYGSPALAAGATRVFRLAGQCEIPPTAKSVATNLTVTGSDRQGHLTVYSGAGPTPLTSSINYRGGQTRANNAIVPLGVGGTLAVVCGQPSGSTHVIIDVTGYFE